jgi:PAS domain-containing protein
MHIRGKVGDDRDPSGLRAVGGGFDATEPRSWFCGYCGRGGPHVESRARFDRVCGACGFGLLLETASRMAPSEHDAFLVIDEQLIIDAISHRAEQLLNARERAVVRKPLTELLVPAASEAQAATRLIAAVAEATSGVAGVKLTHMLLRPVRSQGVRLHARIGRCGSPLAALIVLEPTDADCRDLARRCRAVPRG